MWYFAGTNRHWQGSRHFVLDNSENPAKGNGHRFGAIEGNATKASSLNAPL